MHTNHPNALAVPPRTLENRAAAEIASPTDFGQTERHS
jgi:hypothetical protein